MADFKKHIYFSKEENYFHLALLLLCGAIVLLLIYFAYVSTVLNIDQLGSSFGYGSSKVRLFLIPDKPFYQNQYKVGDRVDAVIALDAPLKKVNGVDVVLEYDPSYLEILTNGVSLHQNNDVAKYLNTEFSSFDIFPYFRVDEEKGRIIFSALSKPLKEFIGMEGKVAELSFKAVKAGDTSIKFDFVKKSNSDSNVASGGKDILESVGNLNLTIQ